MGKESQIRLFEKYQKNPFLEEAIEEINNNIVRKFKAASGHDQRAVLQAYDPKTGETLGHTTFIRQIEVDEEKFTKVYLSQFSAFWELGKQAIKVFGYIMTKLMPGQDIFVFWMSECMDYTQYKNHRSIHQGLTDLLRAKIIARSHSENLYYINPLVIFNGNRVTYAKTYIKKRKNNDENQLALFSHDYTNTIKSFEE